MDTTRSAPQMAFDLSTGIPVLERTPRALQAMLSGRARLILEQGPRRFTPYDRFAQFHESQGKSLHDLLDEFARLRAANLVTLAGWQLTAAHLALEGEHPEFGSVTLRQLLATWVAHDLNHIAQIVRVMAKQYGEAVRPWRAYLSIMNR